MLLSPIGFGAFKIGRNQGVKYARNYDLPNDAAAKALLNAVLDMGINLIDTAPAYGLSEQRIGDALAHRRDEYILSSKVGERFEHGRSTYDFSAAAIRAGIEASLRRLRTDHLDLLFIHSSGDDLSILRRTDAVAALSRAKSAGQAGAIGFSGKTPEGALEALAWADALMVEHHLDDTSHAPVLVEAARQGVGVLVKKGLGAGRLAAADAIAFVLGNPAVTSLVIGSLSADHLRGNVEVARRLDAAAARLP
jgi:aryl-alcohol dehydrogenase-like predicted oxidoreductase